MKNNWVIAPIEAKSPNFEKVWKYDLQNGTIAIGWYEIGNPSSLSESQLRERVRKTFPKHSERTISAESKMIWKFYHEIHEGDTVIARKGTKIVIGLGTVTKEAYYDEPKGKMRLGKEDSYHPNFIDVNWFYTKEVRTDWTFPMQTITSLPSEDYEELRRIIETGRANLSTSSIQFGEEKFLEDFVIGHFNQVFKDEELELFSEDGNTARQYVTNVGRIDILAKEKATGSLVVIELKKGEGHHDVIGQILKYMGWVKDNKESKEVKGIIIAEKFDEGFRNALKMVQDKNLKVKTYRISFDDLSLA